MVKIVKIVKLRIFVCLALAIFAAFIPALSTCESRNIVDDANLFSDAEISFLSQRIGSIQQKGVDVVIWTTRSLPDSSDSRLERYADDFYDDGGYGKGSDHSGVLLMIDMGNRYVHISTSGKMIDFFDDYAIDSLLSSVSSRLGDGNYYSAASVFLSKVESVLSKETTVRTERVDRETGKSAISRSVLRFLTSGELIFSLVVAAAVALIVFLSVYMSYRMKGSSSSDSYTVSSFSLTVNQEQYTHQYTVRTRISSDNNSHTSGGSGHTGGGHSTVHTSSGGSSHGGGGSHF